MNLKKEISLRILKEEDVGIKYVKWFEDEEVVRLIINIVSFRLIPRLIM